MSGDGDNAPPGESPRQDRASPRAGPASATAAEGADDRSQPEQARDGDTAPSAPSSSQDPRAEDVAKAVMGGLAGGDAAAVEATEGGRGGDAGGPKPKQSIPRHRAYDRLTGAEARDRKRNEIHRLEQEVEELQKLVEQNRNVHLCLQTTGVHDLLQTNRELVVEMTKVNSRFVEVLQMLKGQIEMDFISGHDIVRLTSECSGLLRRQSDLKKQAAEQGAVMMVLHDGLSMTPPALLSQTGDVMMATWLLTFIRSNCVKLNPELMADLVNLLPSWKLFEDDLSMQVAHWSKYMQDQGIAQVQQQVVDRLSNATAAPQDGDREVDEAAGPSMDETAHDTTASESAGLFDLQSVLRERQNPPARAKAASFPETMPPELVSCCNIIIKNEQFRCLALELMETKLAPLEFAHFLTIRLKLNEAVANIDGFLKALPPMPDKGREGTGTEAGAYRS